MSALRACIIGCGGIAHSHAHGYTLCPDTKMVACCDLLPAKAESFAREYNIPRHYTDYREMLEQEKPDMVSVTTWNAEHKNASIAALCAGAHVLCEKPMAMDTQEALAMQEAAKKAGKILQIGFVRRFEPTTKVIQNLMADGALGEVYYAKAQYLRRNGCVGGWFGDKAYAGGGPLMDLGVHVIDLVRYLTGKPRFVDATGYTFSNLGRDRAMGNRPEGGLRRDHEFDGRIEFKYDVEDFAGAVIRFESGLVLHVEASFNLNLKENVSKVELFGTKAALTLTDRIELAGVVNDYYMDLTPVGLPKNETAKMFEAQIKHFADCCLNRASCIAPAEDGVALMEILDAVYASAE